MIVCGWCGRLTQDAARCDACDHRDPRIPYEQRNLPVPDGSAIKRRQMVDVEAALRAEGVKPTVERIAERLEVSPRTVRRWREMSAP